jgi:hypothetical protein
MIDVSIVGLQHDINSIKAEPDSDSETHLESSHSEISGIKEEEEEDPLFISFPPMDPANEVSSFSFTHCYKHHKCT